MAPCSGRPGGGEVDAFDRSRSSVLGGRLRGAPYPSICPADPPSLQTVPNLYGVHFCKCPEDDCALFCRTSWNEGRLFLYVLVAWNTRHAVAGLCRLRNVCAYFPSAGQMGARHASRL